MLEYPDSKALIRHVQRICFIQGTLRDCCAALCGEVCSPGGESCDSPTAGPSLALQGLNTPRKS